ncbi:MAG: hypothetical protein H7248_09590 [Microbacteriaceae bacterium]|nr:hypothetical protein [Microbacteriaceae bacterium]
MTHLEHLPETARARRFTLLMRVITAAVLIAAGTGIVAVPSYAVVPSPMPHPSTSPSPMPHPSTSPSPMPLPSTSPSPTPTSAPILPQAPKVLFRDDFESILNAAVKLLNQYRGAMPISMSYTANPFWLNEANCNGMVQSAIGHDGILCALNAESKLLAKVLGVVNHSADPSTNRVVAELTASTAGAANLVELQTARTIPVGAKNRFVTASINVASENCARVGSTSRDAQLQLSLADGANIGALFSTPINPCTAKNTKTAVKGVYAGTFTGDTALLVVGNTVGVTLRNGTGSFLGNDHAFDDLTILDATPQLTTSFMPSTVPLGRSSRLSYRITNTAELAAKGGFSWSNALPAGISVAAVPLFSSTCAAVSAAPVAGATAVSFTASLARDTASCVVSVNVVTASAGAFTNDASRMTLIGLNPAPTAVLTVTAPPRPF